ncbi:hypothetical protein AUQ48_02875 [Kocuria flava]|uniref:Small multidrug efflux protein n=1 Tax=Kocuria flava TaxID=446860 RepID=A0A2N4SZI0_9MICC|nr:hypothetical protein [Kocuria flava]PLC11387.1 hypothetical protein AUQ48_02875 [Kocuria flava]
MLDALQDFTSSLPPLLQWLGVLLAGAVPFVESYFGSVIGVLAGLHPVAAVGAAVVGNVASMLLLVLSAHRLRGRFAGSRKEPSPQRQKLRRVFDRYGVAGVSLLGQTILPSQITATAMVSFGATRNAVILWQIVSIVLWGTAFGLLTALGVDLLARP